MIRPQMPSGEMPKERLSSAILVLATILGALLPMGARATTNLTLPGFTLQNQFDKPRTVTFPRTNVLILAVAGRQSFPQLDLWIQAAKDSGIGPVELVGLADLTEVPRFMRASVRKNFRQTPEVLLDWDGMITSKLPVTRHEASIFVFTGSGKLKLHLTGVATPEAISRLRRATAAAAEDIEQDS